MFEINIEFKERGITQKSVQKKIMNAAVKKLLQEVARRWHALYFPEHFEPGADAKYGYRPRKQDWRERKVRTFGLDVDLVFTGQMRDMMVSMRRVSGTSKKARVVMTGPSYVYFHNKAREATRITPAEERNLMKYAEEMWENLVNQAIDEAREEKTKVK